MYKFSWEKYCGLKAKFSKTPSKDLVAFDGEEIPIKEGYANAIIDRHGKHVTILKTWCDFIPDAPSTFMVFDRETFAKRWPDHENTEWAVPRYGHIMEFKGNSERTEVDGFGFMRSWCRPLTLDDFKREKIAVTFATEAEQKRFLQECEKAGIKMHPHDIGVIGRTEFSPDRQFSMARCGNAYISWLSHPFSYEECTVVPFASFSFPAEAPKPANQIKYGVTPYIPSRSIHITSDGQTTHAVMKEGEKVVKQAEAKCNPTDTYSFQKGAETAFARLWDKPEAKQDVEYMEVKRKAKSGERVKTKSGAVMTVSGMCDRGSDICIMCGSLHLLPFEYVVLLPVRRVHRRAKEGEWVEIVKPDCTNGKYDKGSILKAIGNVGAGEYAQYGPGATDWLYDTEYDVLEGCEEGAKWPEN